ncbi:MAG: TetR/AcrR family transcriptional regulator [Geminicoccaceae bacterium]
MARPREFDPQEALQKAVQMFWEKGYNATSVDEVVRRTGVAKYGIYGTFGTKHELFMKVLEQYAGDRHKDIQRPLRQPDAALPEIRAFFKAVPKLITDKAYPGGCLVANTGVELGQQDPEISGFVKAFFRDTTSVMKGCLERAVERGELDEKTDVSTLATYLVTEFRTALMLARSGHSRRDIERHFGVALRVLS